MVCCHYWCSWNIMKNHDGYSWKTMVCCHYWCSWKTTIDISTSVLMYQAAMWKTHTIFVGSPGSPWSICWLRKIAAQNLPHFWTMNSPTFIAFMMFYDVFFFNDVLWCFIMMYYDVLLWCIMMFYDVSKLIMFHHLCFDFTHRFPHDGPVQKSRPGLSKWPSERWGTPRFGCRWIHWDIIG
jgi:hypothetical protein